MRNHALVDEFTHLYKKNSDCFSFVERMKWPSGFCCCRCGHRSAYKVETRNIPLYECRSCRHQESLTSNTIMHKSRTPLWKWLFVFYIIGKSDSGVNAVHLSKLIQVTYKTAWSMLHKTRTALSQANEQQMMEGATEIKHEIFMKQPIPTEARLNMEKSAAIARAENGDNGIFYKIKLIPRIKQARDNLTAAEQEQLLVSLGISDPQRVVLNPRFQQYKKPSKSSWTEENLPTRDPLSLVATEAFQWLNDTFHGLGLKHAQSYLDEFCLRLNGSTGAIRCPYEYVLELALRPNQQKYDTATQTVNRQTIQIEAA